MTMVLEPTAVLESTEPTSTDKGTPFWANRGFVAACILAMIVFYAAAVPHRGYYGHFDHYAFAKTVELMDHGENYYDAFRDAFDIQADPPSQARDFRPPLPFLVWRMLPYDHLYTAYLVLVVGATSLLLLFATKHPIAVLPVTLFLLLAGREAGSPSFEAWLLAEAWTVPLIAGSFLAWKFRRWWWAAALAALAVFTRELTFPVLVMGLVLAHQRGLPRKPWIVCGLAAAVGLAAHFVVAAHHTVPWGHEAQFFGTGMGLTSVLFMITWMLPMAAVLGPLLFTIAVVYMYRHRDTWLLWPLMLVPLAGFITNRPYWGLLFIPFMLLFAAEAVIERFITRSRAPAAA
jgi:hypothetical protein